MKLKIIIPLILLVPANLYAADNLFIDPEDEQETISKDSSIISGLLGSDQLPINKSGKWEKFRPLEAYGQSPESIVPVQDPNELYQQEQATKEYLRARDPFSNYERLDKVREMLDPAPQ